MYLLSPYARQPVSHEHVEAQQQDEHCGPVFQVAVEFPHHSAEAQQSDDFQGAEKAPDALEAINKGLWKYFAEGIISL